MRTSVNTEELRVQADRLLQLNAEVEGALRQVRQQLNRLEDQTCGNVKDDLRSAIRQLQDVRDSIEDLQHDLNKIAAVYENTENDVHRMVRALANDGYVLPRIIPWNRRYDYQEIQLDVVRYADITHYVASGLVYLLQTAEYINPIGSWSDKKYFIIPETVLQVDDWLKYRLMEAFANEHI